MNAVFHPWPIREFRERSGGIPEFGREDTLFRRAGAFFGRTDRLWHSLPCHLSIICAGRFSEAAYAVVGSVMNAEPPMHVTHALRLKAGERRHTRQEDLTVVAQHTPVYLRTLLKVWRCRRDPSRSIVVPSLKRDFRAGHTTGTPPRTEFLQTKSCNSTG